MSECEVNVKLNVDTTQLDEVIEKVKQLKECLWVVNGLIEELTEESDVDLATTITIDSEAVAQGLHNSQLAKESKAMDARIEGGLNRSRY